jgi:hypothetical protein
LVAKAALSGAMVATAAESTCGWDGYASIFRHEPEEIEFIAHNAKTEIGPVRKYVNPYVDPCPE